MLHRQNERGCFVAHEIDLENFLRSERTLSSSVFRPEVWVGETRRSNSTKGPLFNASIMRLEEREGGSELEIRHHSNSAIHSEDAPAFDESCT